MQALPFFCSLVLVLGSVGCSGGDDQGSGNTTSGSGGENASGGGYNSASGKAVGGASALGGAGGSAVWSTSKGGAGGTLDAFGGGTGINLRWNDEVTSNCAAWPRSKVLPKTGPFFYGPDPGPCRIGTAAGFVNGTEYTYDSNGRLQTYNNLGRVVRYNYQGDLIVSFTIGGSEAIDGTVSYEGASIVARRETEDTRFELDAQGYPRRVTYDMDHDGTPDWGRLYQYESCRLVRIFLDPDLPAPPPTITVSGNTYEYDDAGHVKASRSDSGSVETYDYACWQ